MSEFIRFYCPNPTSGKRQADREGVLKIRDPSLSTKITLVAVRRAERAVVVVVECGVPRRGRGPGRAAGADVAARRVGPHPGIGRGDGGVDARRVVAGDQIELRGGELLEQVDALV